MGRVLSPVDRANRYVEGVLSGEVPACRWVVAACQRQRDDLANPPDGFRFDEEKASRPVRFIEIGCKHIKGELAGKPIELEDFQCFILCCVFGWVDDDGYRRFQKVYTEVPRKNAKSTLMSGIALYMLGADGEGGAEVYSAATTRDQARIVFGDAQNMVHRSPFLRQKIGLTASAHAVVKMDNASTFKALSRDQGGNLDGLNIHFAVVDELHGHKDRALLDVIVTGTGARRQPIVWEITTAGFNRAGICYEERTYLTRILSREVDDDRVWGCIWTIDEGDDPWSEDTWRKANPNWGVSVSPESIRREARKAMRMASAQPNFLTKHLNIWVGASSQWMDMSAWERQKDVSLTIDDFAGDKCWVGLDLASTKDIASVAHLFERGGNFYLFVKHFIPSAAVESERNSQYYGWSTDGWLTTTPGNVIDQSAVEEHLRVVSEQFEIADVAYDPWGATYLIQRLMERGVSCCEVRQGYRSLSEPMKRLEALVLDHKLFHNGDPVLAWMMSNVVPMTDPADNVKPAKEYPENKIDGVVASIMALAAFMFSPQDSRPSVYESRGLLTF